MKKSKFPVLFIIAFIIILIVNFKDDPDAHLTDFSEFDYSNLDYSDSDQSDNVHADFEEKDSFSSYYYDQLTDYQKNIYNCFKEPVANGETEVIFDNVRIDDFNDNCFAATVAFQYDHPEYFWFTGGYSYSSTRRKGSGNGRITLTPDYYEYAVGLFGFDSKKAELEGAVKKVAALARANSADDYESIIFVHDYLVQNAYYDDEALDEYYKTNRSPSCEYIFSAYGCLVNGKTVCSGYAKAFQLIMKELGYNCIYVVGDAGEAHGWNCVFLDGEGYYVDVTWDDYDFDNNEPFYNYCFITSEALARTHTVDTVYETPVCTATKYRYFIYREYYAEKYSYLAVSSILQKQKGNGAIHIQFGSFEELEKACNDLINNGKFGSIPGMNAYTKYHRNDNHYTMSFYN